MNDEQKQEQEEQEEKLTKQQEFPTQEMSRTEKPPLKIDKIFSDAFDQSTGFKFSFFKAFALVFLFFILIGGLQAGIEFIGNGTLEPPKHPTPKGASFTVLAQLISILLTTPLSVGLLTFALRRVRGESYSATNVFLPYAKIIPLFFTMIIMYLFIIIGFILLVIPGIYLLIAYYFANILVADKGLGPWQALEASRKTVSKHWFTVFLITIALTVVNLIAVLPLGIGLIWSLPWSMLVYAELYKYLFDE